MSSWVEQGGEFFCFGIDAGKVWPFVEVATEAGISEIVEAVSATMLLGDDVFDLKRCGDMGTGKTAVFASVSRALAYLFLGGFVHPWVSRISTGATFAL